jgi:membrane-associated phospholipid phosphatase
VAYTCFLVYPTVAPRPAKLIRDGFAVCGLRFLYGADPPYNCFPSIHVAHAFVSALACHRVHRTLGLVALLSAALVAVSTLFTKQHYIADVITGILLAVSADAVFLRSYSRANIPDGDRRLAPILALYVTGLVGLGAACFWVAYQLSAWV